MVGKSLLRGEISVSLKIRGREKEVVATVMPRQEDFCPSSPAPGSSRPTAMQEMELLIRAGMKVGTHLFPTNGEREKGLVELTF